jgi:tripartite-type tricarboxylate transporter receptor subunit TctC
LASVWQGKTITLVVGAEAGGGYDTWARLAAKHLQKQLPGNPNIIVQNMPGGNHRVATNYLYGMKGDGLTLGLIERYIPSYQLSGEGPNEGVRFDVTKFDWIGSAAVTTPALVVHQRIGITPSNLEQLKQRPIRVAQQAPGSSQHIWAVLSREILGYKFENIFGFKSNPEASLSMRRGETEGMITDSETLARIFDQEFKTGEVLALMLYGDRKPGSVWEKAPTIMDLVGDKNAEAKQMVDFARLPFSWSRPFLSPPGTPATVVATLRAAFTTMMADPEFLADADQQKLEVTPLDGASMTTLLTDYMKTPKAIIDKVNAMIEADSPR